MRARVVDARRRTGGYTAAERWSLTLNGGRRVFAKGGPDRPTSSVATWLRDEHRWYEWFAETGMRFAPAMLGWLDEDDHPLLVLDDLSDAHWPPPWDDHTIGLAREVLGELARITPPDWAITPEERFGSLSTRWDQVAGDPRPLLSLGIVSAGWLERGLPTLREAAAAVGLDGRSLVHGDFRSDNLCFTAGRGMQLLDWNWAMRGDPRIDEMFWLPSLSAEGGPAPWDVVTDSRGWSALTAGVVAAHLAPPEDEPVRNLQRSQLEVCLPWAARELGLPPPDGPPVRS